MKKNIAIFLSLLFLTFQSAKADVAIGLTAAAHSLDASGTETTRTSNEKNVGGNTEDVLVPEIFVEATADNGVSIGLAYIPTRELGNKSRSDTNSDGDTGTYTAKAELDNVVQLYVDVPFAETFGSTVYGKVGIQHATITTLESLNSGSSYPDEEIDGTFVGAGYQSDIGDAGVFWRAEGQYQMLDDISLTGSEEGGTSGSKNVISAELGSVMASFSIGMKF